MPALTGVLVSAAPLLVSLMTLGMPQERGGPLRLLGVGVGFVGVAVLLGFELPHRAAGWRGHWMILLRARATRAAASCCGTSSPAPGPSR